jgi:TP901 family phage tail tape measure protein
VKIAFTAADRLLGGVKKAVGALAAIGTVKLGASMFKGVADLADGLDELAQKTGVPIEALQEFGYAAGFSGVSIEELGGHMGRLVRNMDAARRGSKVQAQAFREAGIAIKDSSGDLRPVDDVLGDLADKVAAMPDGADKAALVFKVLGRSGAQMIPVLNEGRAGLERLRKEARESGKVIDGDTAKAFAEFNDNLDRTKAQVEGVKIQIASALLPALSRLLERVLAWVKANRKLLIAKITNALRTLGNVLVTLYRVLGPIVAAMYEFVAAVVTAADRIGILKYALVAAALAVGAAWAGALLPFVLLAAAIGAVILIVEDLYRAFTGGDSVIKDALQPAIDWLYDTFGGFFSWYEERMIALGLMKGKDVVSNRMLGDKRAREFQSGKATSVYDPNPFLNGTLAQQARNQAFITARRPQYAKDYLRSAGLAMAGIPGGVSPTVTPSAKGGPTVNVGGHTVTVNAAPGQDAKAVGDEVDKRLREFAAEQARAMVASVGGTR